MSELASTSPATAVAGYRYIDVLILQRKMTMSGNLAVAVSCSRYIGPVEFAHAEKHWPSPYMALTLDVEQTTLLLK